MYTESTPKCDHCGRFFTWKDYDQYTDFGRSTDTTPPDPVFMCGRCAEEEFRRFIDTQTLPSRWCPSDAECRAAEELGYERHYNNGGGWKKKI